MKSKTIKRFSKMIRPYKKTIFIVTLMALFIDVCELIKPLFVKEIMEKYLPNNVFVQNGISIGMIFIAYITIVLLENIVDYVNRAVTSKMGEGVVYKLRENYMIILRNQIFLFMIRLLLANYLLELLTIRKMFILFLVMLLQLFQRIL